MLKNVFCLLLLASLNAVASDRFVPGPDNKAEAKGILTVTVGWIKDKGSKYDINLIMRNEKTDAGIIVFLSDLGCQRGEVTGSLKHTFFNTGEKTIDFRPHQTKDFNLVCKVEGKPKGDFKISVASVYSNPSLDGKTVGKVIAKDLRWSQSDRTE